VASSGYREQDTSVQRERERERERERRGRARALRERRRERGLSKKVREREIVRWVGGREEEREIDRGTLRPLTIHAVAVPSRRKTILSGDKDEWVPAAQFQVQASGMRSLRLLPTDTNCNIQRHISA
jgi:hypothetical protein